jgi:hypothetical protein
MHDTHFSLTIAPTPGISYEDYWAACSSGLEKPENERQQRGESGRKVRKGSDKRGQPRTRDISAVDDRVDPELQCKTFDRLIGTRQAGLLSVRATAFHWIEDV